MKFERLAHKLASEPWAILPSALEAMVGYLGARMRGDAPDLAEMEANLPGQLRSRIKVELTAEDLLAGAVLSDEEGADLPYQLVDGVALVEICGALVKKPSWCFASMEEIRQTVQAALDDPAVQAILLSFDSPGGTVDGTTELAAFLASAGEQKPLYAYADGLMASAAYWLGCSAVEIAASAAASVGSIGVITVHTDMSKAYEARGLKQTFITAGEFKAAGNDAEPLDEKARGYFQERIDQLGELFFSAVATGRHIDPQRVRDTQARVYLAGSAVEAGLIDRVVSDRAEFINIITEGFSMNVTLKQLKAKNPALVEQIKAEMRAESEDDKKDGCEGDEDKPAGAEDNEESAEGDKPQGKVAKAVAAERKRILALAEVAFGDQAKAFADLVGSGVDAKVVKAMSGLFGGSSAGASDSAQILAGLEKAHESKGLRNTGALAPKGGAQDFMALVEARMQETGESKGQAMAWATEAHPEAHEAYLAKAKGAK